ncbi:hypothetical protein GN956_G2741 [Arapaima gigas]
MWRPPHCAVTRHAGEDEEPFVPHVLLPGFRGPLLDFWSDAPTGLGGEGFRTVQKLFGLFTLTENRGCRWTWSWSYWKMICCCMIICNWLLYSEVMFILSNGPSERERRVEEEIGMVRILCRCEQTQPRAVSLHDGS